MWHEQQQDLAQRRAVLLLRSRALRRRLGDEAQVLERPLALADGARSRARWWVAHPYGLAGLAALPLLPLLLRPRLVLGWALKLWSGWRAWRQLRALLPPRPARVQPPWNPPAR